MMNHIDMSSVLRQTLAVRSLLQSRHAPTGAAVRGQIEQLLERRRRARAHRHRLLARVDDRLLVRRRSRREAAACATRTTTRAAGRVLPLPRRDGRPLGRDRDGARAPWARARARARPTASHRRHACATASAARGRRRTVWRGSAPETSRTTSASTRWTKRRMRSTRSCSAGSSCTSTATMWR